MKENSKVMNWIMAMRGNPALTDPLPIVTDPDGSYTVRPVEPGEKPVQDADDL